MKKYLLIISSVFVVLLISISLIASLSTFQVTPEVNKFKELTIKTMSFFESRRAVNLAEKSWKEQFPGIVLEDWKPFDIIFNYDKHIWIVKPNFHRFEDNENIISTVISEIPSIQIDRNGKIIAIGADETQK